MALKVCRIPALATNVGGPHDVFTMESGIGEALRHPNVVQIFGSEVLAVTRKKNRGAEDIDGDRSFTECPEEDSVFSAVCGNSPEDLKFVWVQATLELRDNISRRSCCSCP